MKLLAILQGSDVEQLMEAASNWFSQMKTEGAGFQALSYQLVHSEYPASHWALAITYDFNGKVSG